LKTYKIHLIRHGMTEGNRKGQYIGRTDSLLTKEGLEEVQTLAQNYSYPKGETYFVSPLLRCVQTLHALYPGEDALEVPGLSECDFGEWEGKSAEDLKDDPLFLDWIQSGQTAAPPGGESTQEFVSRVCGTFEKLLESLMRTGTTESVIVAHGGTIMTILAAYGLPSAPFYDWMCGNGCGYSIRVTPNLWMTGQKFEVYDTIPPSLQQNGAEGEEALNLAREAAERAFRVYMPKNDD